MYSPEKELAYNSVRRFNSIKKREMKMEKKRSFWKGAVVGWGVFMLMYVLYSL